MLALFLSGQPKLYSRLALASHPSSTTTTIVTALKAIEPPNKMLSTARSRAVLQLSRRVQPAARRAYAFSANENKEINVGSTPKEVPNISKSNELPIETPHRDAPLQESVQDAEKLRIQQAPNRAAVWSRSQNPRAKAMSGPRFEQTIMELQVRQNFFDRGHSWSLFLSNWIFRHLLMLF